MFVSGLELSTISILAKIVSNFLTHKLGHTQGLLQALFHCSHKPFKQSSPLWGFWHVELSHNANTIKVILYYWTVLYVFDYLCCSFKSLPIVRDY